MRIDGGIDPCMQRAGTDATGESVGVPDDKMLVGGFPGFLKNCWS
jgi:hypothetical protein